MLHMQRERSTAHHEPDGAMTCQVILERTVCHCSCRSTLSSRTCVARSSPTVDTSSLPSTNIIAVDVPLAPTSGFDPTKAIEPGTLVQLSNQQVLAVALTNANPARLLIAQGTVMLEAAGTLLGTTADTDLVVTPIRALVK